MTTTRKSFVPGLGLLCVLAMAACSGGGGITLPKIPIPPPPTFTVGGSVSGLAGSGLVLQDNGGNDLPVAASGNFVFSTALASGAAFNVTVKTQPLSPTQTCVVANATGTVGSANVTNLAVTCTTNTYSIGGNVTGLTGAGLVLQDNAGNDLTVAAGSSTFTFSTLIASGASYAGHRQDPTDRSLANLRRDGGERNGGQREYHECGRDVHHQDLHGRRQHHGTDGLRTRAAEQFRRRPDRVGDQHQLYIRDGCRERCVLQCHGQDSARGSDLHRRCRLWNGGRCSGHKCRGDVHHSRSVCMRGHGKWHGRHACQQYHRE